MDEHVPTAIIDGLRRRGEDVLTVQEDGFGGAADELVLNRALILERVLFTQDKDFLKIASQCQRSGQPFAGVVYSPQRGISPGRCISDLELIAGVLDSEELINQVVRIPIR